MQTLRPFRMRSFIVSCFVGQWLIVSAIQYRFESCGKQETVSQMIEVPVTTTAYIVAQQQAQTGALKSIRKSSAINAAANAANELAFSVFLQKSRDLSSIFLSQVL